jgi:hypothetical protein
MIVLLTQSGYPIATGVAEGTCGSLIKDRVGNLACAGLSTVPSQSSPECRGRNGDWNDFFTYYINVELDRTRSYRIVLIYL